MNELRIPVGIRPSSPTARSFYIYHLLAMLWRVQQFLVKAELKL